MSAKPNVEISRMPENPLLPHAELWALLALTKRCMALESASARKGSSAPRRRLSPTHASREAVLAATTLQLRSGDLLITEPSDCVAIELRSESAGKKLDKAVLPAVYTKGASRLLLAAAMASALRSAGTDKFALFLTQTRSADPGWQTALKWVQDDLLPLVLVCTDASGPAIFSSKGKTAKNTLDTLATLQWSSISPFAAKHKIPILTVDGEDAVAMYRTAQEAILRARTGGGPAVLWAALPTPAELAGRSRTQRPIAKLAQYLRARGVPIL